MKPLNGACPSKLRAATAATADARGPTTAAGTLHPLGLPSHPRRPPRRHAPARRAQVLLNARARIDETSDRACTALALAAEEGNTEILKLLLENNAKPRVPDKLGFTALGLACENGHAEAARMLLAANGDPNETRENGWTNMITAAYNGATEVVQVLAEGGADGYTTVHRPLHLPSHLPLHLM